MKKAFTLLELVVVIIILGVLATLGLTQYGSMVERARTAEARTVLGDMRKLAAAYRLANGTITGMTNADVNIGTGTDQIPEQGACRSTHYFQYWVCTAVCAPDPTVWLYARRCQAGGKSPQGNQAFAWYVILKTNLVTGADEWEEFPYSTP